MPPKPSSGKSTARKSTAAPYTMEDARQELAAIMPQALEFLGAAPMMAPGTGAAGAQTIALPVGSGTTLVGALRNRPNWYKLARREIDLLARLVIERNWFVRPVHDSKVNVYAHGFRFASKEANAWAAEGTYDFAQYVRDMIEEYHASGSIVVWWRRDVPSGTLPALNVPNLGDVEYQVVGGIRQITLTLERDGKLKDEQKSVLGDRMFEAIKKGKKLVIPENDTDFDFRVMKTGKSASPFGVSPLVTIFDDLDFIEAVRIGDWTGAKARMELIRQTKKGYNTSSGPNAGNVRNHAKPQDLKAIVKGMKEILGKMDIATNFDQEIGYITLPEEFFNPQILAEVKQRLLHYAGVFGIMLLKTDSQITGLSEFMMQMLRAEVFAFRDRFDKFLISIFSAESFRNSFKSAPPLVPAWPVKHLYTAKALNELIVTCATYALNAPQSLRALLDINDDEESALMLKAHEDPKRYTPPYEPRQGIAAAFVTPDAGGNQNQQTMPGEPGAPTKK